MFYCHVHTHSLNDSIAKMSALVNQEERKWKELDNTLAQLKQECVQLNTELTEFSTIVPGLQDEYNKLDGSVSLCNHLQRKFFISIPYL